MKNNYLRFAFIGLSALLIFHIAGCNTIEGVGKDVKRAGESIEKAGENGKKK
jgi:predicted small secreted protein